jgi:adenylylsulfate kinase-like enzyme|tara:strand:+ start:1723 stop:2196 length:474 start_codon:yes stop_codon:yes gene_type:complete
MKKNKGIWLYGLSGSGKSFISKKIKLKKKKSIIIDGDEVRKYVSSDLGYTLKDRKVQLNRVYGIAKLVVNSGYYPIISTVYLNTKTLNLCKKIKILPIRVKRKDFDKVISTHKTYKNTKNVVGKDIKYPKLKTIEIINNNKNDFVFQNPILKINKVI